MIEMILPIKLKAECIYSASKYSPLLFIEINSRAIP